MTDSKDKRKPDFKEPIIGFLGAESYRPLKAKELARALEISPAHYTEFRRQLRAMLHAGEVIRLHRGRLAAPAKIDLIRGRVHAHRRGFAFVIPDDGSTDIYIEPDHIKTAMHEDIVLVQKLPTSFRGRPEGRIVRIVLRGHPRVVGTFQQGKHFSFVVPEDERLPRDIYIPRDHMHGAKPGQVVVVQLAEWDDPARAPEGRIVEVLGFPDEPGVDVLTVIFEHALPLEFPREVEEEALKPSARLSRSELDGREDHRELPVATIDPHDAKDHDDALSVRELEDGLFEVGVHIADVSHYVRPDTALDREALLRGTSVYLVDRVVPMLPHRLSGDLCSLKADVDRLALTCFLVLDSEAKLKSFRLCETVIRSAADLTYEQVQEYFDTGNLSKSLSPLAQPLNTLLALSRKLTEARMKEGSLDFDLPESRIELAPDGSVSNIYELVRLPSHRLVEEFMLLANRTVARYLQTTGVPVLYRVHDRPDSEKLESFAAFVSTLGLKFNAGDSLRPRHLQQLLESAKGLPEEGLINEVLLRSMAKAVYQPENIGHFGLAFDRYVHFTSPIRRYPDLLVHRAVKRKLRNEATPEWVNAQKGTLFAVGRHCSERERVAMEAERDSVRIKQIAFMETQLGETFTGLISGVRTFGLFVKLDRILVEGLLPIGTLGNEYYTVDEARYLARGRSTGKVFRLGDPVTVQVVRVDPVSKQVDFRLLTPEGEATPVHRTDARKGAKKGGKKKPRGKPQDKPWKKPQDKPRHKLRKTGR